MNCQKARELIELRLDHALEKVAARKLDEHMAACSSCRAVYLLLQAENDLLEKAMQADLSSAENMRRLEDRVRERTVVVPARFVAVWDWALPLVGVPAIGTVFGLLVLVSGRFDGLAVREAISWSLSPVGGLVTAIPSALLAVCFVLGVLMIQPRILSAISLNNQKENGHV